MANKITGEDDPRVKCFVGRKFNRLEAVRFVGMQGSGQLWEFKCDCGGSKTILMKNVEKGITGSCGCLHHEMLLRRNTKHGQNTRANRHPMYGVWCGMLARCHNPNRKSYPDYGGRGITVCERWHTFQNFFDDMSATYQRGLMIERVDNEKGYCPENCVWETRKVQNNNKRNVRRITFNGKTLTRQEWANEIGGNERIITTRLRRGWSEERAVSTPAGAIGSNQAGMIPK
jgi:hypothetical protein